MDLSRAAKFGLYGSIGFILLWTMLLMVIREIEAGVEGGTLEGNITVLVIVLGGTLVSLIFLFTLIGEYVDREFASGGFGGADGE